MHSKVIYRLEQSRSQYITDISNIEKKFVLQLQKQECEQEDEAKNLQTLGE
jgi:hypothetical protein